MAQGNVDELLEHFPAYMAALKSLGHDAFAHIIDSETLSKSMLSWAKESHKLHQKGLEHDKRIDFDEDATKELISSVIDSSCSYLVGFEISPSTSRALWMCEDTRPVMDIDFAHMYQTGMHSFAYLNVIFLEKSRCLGGVVGSAVFTDANSGIIPATFSRFMGNESKDAQTKLVRGALRAHTGINSASVRIITDGEKGFPGVIEKEVPLATQMLDKRHKKEALRKLPGGKEAATAYEKCFEAKTPAEINAIKMSMTPGARDILEKVPDENLFPCVRGGFYGIEKGAHVESFNNQLGLNGIRSVAAPLQARDFMEMAKRKFEEDKAAALAWKKN
jgi:hypothetical protein